MSDWETWRSIGATAWDWGAKMGLGGLLFGVVRWVLQRRISDHDKSVERGRSKLEKARPEVVPVAAPVTVNNLSTVVELRNRGVGPARDVRVTFTGSSAVGRISEIEPGKAAFTEELHLSDTPFFRQRLAEPAELVVRFKDRFECEYTVVLPVEQDDRGTRFDMRPVWGGHRVIEPSLSKRRLREIGGS